MTERLNQKGSDIMTEQKCCEKCGRRLTEEEQQYLDGLCSECELQILLDFNFDEVEEVKTKKSEV